MGASDLSTTGSLSLFLVGADGQTFFTPPLEYDGKLGTLWDCYKFVWDDPSLDTYVRVDYRVNLDKMVAYNLEDGKILKVLSYEKS